MKRTFLGLAGVLLAGCGGGSTAPASYDALRAENLGFASVFDGPTTTSLLSTEFPSGDARFDGTFVIFESFEQGGETVEDFGVVGEVSLVIDFEDSVLSGQMSNVFEYTPAAGGLANATAGVSVEADLTLAQSGGFRDTGNTGFFASGLITGTIQKTDGEIANYDLSPNFGLFAAEGETLSGVLGVGDGTSVADGREEKDVTVAIIGARQ